MYPKRSEQHAGKHGTKGKAGAFIISLLVLLTVTVGGTVAYLVANTIPVVNTFTPSQVSCKVEETFTNNVKSNITVENTSNINAYLRVKLVSYRVNDANQHIGGIATIPAFDLGTDWVKHTDGYYYYTEPVAPNGITPSLIADNSLALTGSYTDADGGKQVIEVMAEAIQAEPARAVGEAWGVSISENSVTSYVVAN